MSESPASREMTLSEWVMRLPEKHRARKEFIALESSLAQARADVEALRDIQSVCGEIMDEVPRQDADEVPDWLDTLLGKLSWEMVALPEHLRGER